MSMMTSIEALTTLQCNKANESTGPSVYDNLAQVHEVTSEGYHFLGVWAKPMIFSREPPKR